MESKGDISDQMATKRIAITIAFSLMSFFSVAGNLHIMYTISAVRRLQTVANSFLFSLAVADFIVGAIVIPTSLVTTIANKWLTGTVVCDFSAFVDNVTLTMSMWSLGLLSIERLFLMVFPFRYRTYITYKSATILISSSWLTVAFICVCPMLGWGQYGYTDMYSCGILPVQTIPDYYYFLFFCIGAFLPPIAAGTFSYIGILHILIKQRCPAVFSGNSATKKLKRTVVEKRENVVACLSVFICLLLMIIFNLPTVIIGLCFWSGINLYVPESVSLFFHIAWYAKSAANPVIFGVLNRKFRNEFSKYRAFKYCFAGKVKREQSSLLEITAPPLSRGPHMSIRKPG